MMSHAISLIASNALLALYPIVIKWYPHITTLDHTFLRIIAILVAAYSFTSPNIWSILTAWPMLFIGLVNIIHIYSSYEAYKHLTAGVATGIFYIYPIFIAIFGWLLLDEQITLKSALAIIVSFAGVLLIQYDQTKNGNDVTGYISIIIAAITEAIIIIFYKMNPIKNAFDRIFTLYALSLFPVIGILIYRGTSLKLQDIGTMTIFHVICGFGGYLLRLYAIDLPTATFSILSYTQIIFAFIFGYWLLDQTATITDLAGICCILVATYFYK